MPLHPRRGMVSDVPTGGGRHALKQVPEESYNQRP